MPKGIIVLKEPIEPQALLDFVAERVAPHKRIRHLEFVDKIPKSPSGKILRRVLVEMEKAKAVWPQISQILVKIGVDLKAKMIVRLTVSRRAE